MAYIERTDEEIIAAWEEWVKNNPAQANVIAVTIGQATFSMKDVVDQIKCGHEPFLSIFVTNARQASRQNGEDPVSMILQAKPVL